MSSNYIFSSSYLNIAHLYLSFLFFFVPNNIIDPQLSSVDCQLYFRRFLTQTWTKTITDRPSTTAEQKCLQERCVYPKEACRYRMFPSDIVALSTKVKTETLVN